MRRLSRCLHTIRLELNNNVDCARLPSLASFCVVPKAIEEKKEPVIRSAKSSTFRTSKNVATQQIRKYVPTSSTMAETACWNCKERERKNHMLCLSCGVLQDVDNEIVIANTKFEYLIPLILGAQFYNCDFSELLSFA